MAQAYRLFSALKEQVYDICNFLPTRQTTIENIEFLFLSRMRTIGSRYIAFGRQPPEQPTLLALGTGSPEVEITVPFPIGRCIEANRESQL